MTERDNPVVILKRDLVSRDVRIMYIKPSIIANAVGQKINHIFYDVDTVLDAVSFSSSPGLARNESWASSLFISSS